MSSHPQNAGAPSLLHHPLSRHHLLTRPPGLPLLTCTCSLASTTWHMSRMPPALLGKLRPVITLFSPCPRPISSHSHPLCIYVCPLCNRYNALPVGSPSLVIVVHAAQFFGCTFRCMCNFIAVHAVISAVVLHVLADLAHAGLLAVHAVSSAVLLHVSADLAHAGALALERLWKPWRAGAR